MEKNQKIKVTPKIISKVLSTVILILITIMITAFVTNHKNVSETQEIIQTLISAMEEREKTALKQGFKWGIRAMAMEVTSECFHEDLEDLKNTPEENIIEFRFKDGKLGRIKHWETKGE